MFGWKFSRSLLWSRILSTWRADHGFLKFSALLTRKKMRWRGFSLISMHHRWTVASRREKSTQLALSIDCMIQLGFSQLLHFRSKVVDITRTSNKSFQGCHFWRCWCFSTSLPPTRCGRVTMGGFLQRSAGNEKSAFGQQNEAKRNSDGTRYWLSCR